MKRTRIAAVVAATAVTAAALAGCSGSSNGSGGSDKATLTFRTWDTNAAAAYKEAFAAYHKANPNVTVTVDVVPWANYFTKLRTDIAGGSADDLFWINNSSYSSYATSGALIDIDDLYGDDAESTEEGWAPAVVDQFTQDDTLWGIPQTSDAGIAVYYNKKLLEDAGLSADDIASLDWNTADGGSLVETAEKLTKDSNGKTAADKGFDAKKIKQYGYSASQDIQASLLPTIGSNGGTYQEDDKFTFTNPKTEEAIGFLVDLINKYHVAPSAADTNDNGNFNLEAFQQGKLALFQSGLYNLANVQDKVDFDWGAVQLPAGPAGAVSVTNGIAVVGNAKTKHEEATDKVLKWLGSAEGNKYIGESGANLPAVLDAQDAYTGFWKSKDVDLAPFFDVIDGKDTIPAPTGENFNEAYAAYSPVLSEVFLGKKKLAAGLAEAETAANKAVEG